jgi:precorrin-6B methylase 2
MTRRATLLLMLALILSGSDTWADSAGGNTSAALQAQPGTPPPGQKRPDAPQLAPYVPTPQDVVDRMLRLAGVTKTDVVLDLGCGDGRIPISAAKTYGARGIGVDIDPQRIAEANANAKAAGVTHLVTFKLEDAMTTDLSQATVVTLYLLSSSNLKLRPILTRQLKPGTRIVAHNFAMGDWEAEKIDTFQDKEGRTRTLYRWTTDGRVRQ